MTDYSRIVDELAGNGYLVAMLWEDRAEKISLEIDGNKVELKKRHELGNTCPDEVNRVRLTYRVATAESGHVVIDTERLKRDLSEGGRLSVLIDRVIAGHQVAYGADMHRFGFMTPDAYQAADEIADVLDCRFKGDPSTYTDDTVRVWTPREWLHSGGQTNDEILSSLGLSADSTDAEIAEAADREYSDRLADGDVIVGDLKTAVQDAVESLRREAA